MDYVSVNLTTEKMLVKYDEAAVSSDGIVAMVEKLGYGCLDASAAEREAARARKEEQAAAAAAKKAAEEAKGE